MEGLKELLKGWSCKKNKLLMLVSLKILSNRRKKRRKLAARNGNRSSSRFGNTMTSWRGQEEVGLVKKMNKLAQSTSYQS
jgi:hypothetical protein